MKWILVGVALWFFTGCATKDHANTLTWPEASGIPSSLPAGLSAETSATLLKQGSDGRLYVLGRLENAQVGSRFFARYSGDWPLQDMPRPPFLSGEVIHKYSDEAALVQVIYALPEVEVEGLEITWEDPKTLESIGKGLARFSWEEGAETVAFDADDLEGIQPGDLYALIRDEPGAIARRIVRICEVNDVAEQATCRLRESPEIPELKLAASGTAVFLEHTYGKPPLAAEIRVVATEAEVGDRVVEALRAYLATKPRANVKVVLRLEEIDPRRADFHRIERSESYDQMATILVGAVAEGDSLRLNYAGVGPASGPGMIAAPPEGGVLVKRDAELANFAGLIFSAVQVYRGQTSEALIQIRELLADSTLKGPMRWHLRDQFAMRFAALGRMDDALALIEQDMEFARLQEDEEAYLNALGTVVRLHDMEDRPDRALATSAEYLQARKKNGSPTAQLSAVSMHIEMLLAKEKMAEAKTAIEQMQAMCPTGCDGDLAALLSGVFWAMPKDSADSQEELLKTIQGLAEAEKGSAEASLRVYQGLWYFGQGDIEQGLIAFLEAERLYKELGYAQGVGRALFLRMLVQMTRGEPDDAVEAGKSAIEVYRKLQDFPQVAMVYQRLSGLYANLDGSLTPGPWLGAGEHVMLGAIAAASAMGNVSGVADASFNLGTFLIRVGQASESKTAFQRAAIYAIRTARFEIAAMSHLSLAMIARQEGNFETFRDEIRRAQEMAKASGDPELETAIERALMPPQEPESPPTLSL